jgi:hypothetical protein
MTQLQEQKIARLETELRDSLRHHDVTKTDVNRVRKQLEAIKEVRGYLGLGKSEAYLELQIQEFGRKLQVYQDRKEDIDALNIGDSVKKTRIQNLGKDLNVSELKFRFSTLKLINNALKS